MYLWPLSGPAGWRSAGTGLPAFCAMTAMLVSKDSSLVRSQSTSSKAPATQGMKLCSDLLHASKPCRALQWLEASLQSFIFSFWSLCPMHQKQQIRISRAATHSSSLEHRHVIDKCNSST